MNKYYRLHLWEVYFLVFYQKCFKKALNFRKKSLLVVSLKHKKKHCWSWSPLQKLEGSLHKWAVHSCQYRFHQEGPFQDFKIFYLQWWKRVLFLKRGLKGAFLVTQLDRMGPYHKLFYCAMWLPIKILEIKYKNTMLFICLQFDDQYATSTPKQ